MFKSLALRKFMIYALVIGGSFSSGIFIYPYYFSKNLIHQNDTVALKEFKATLAGMLEKDFELYTANKKTVVKNDELKEWIQPYIRSYSGKEDLRVLEPAVTEYVRALAPLFAIEPVDAKLKFTNGKADMFIPSRNGQRLNIASSVALITSSLISGAPSASVKFDAIEPEITLDKINDLGINTLLGKGESDYGKSPSSRIHNIEIGMAKFNGILLKPGQDFSFNEILGEVNAANGYESELVIKSGELVKEYGGGLCQVSTTMFRAAVNTGLPITERRPHSFTVQYYNPQGFDSTIYPGVVDLKFENDTKNHILIQTKLVGSRLSIEIYGSNDGRKVEVTTPIQYDIESSGAMRTYFTRTIKLNDGTIKEERFNSSYKAHPLSPLERNPLE